MIIATRRGWRAVCPEVPVKAVERTGCPAAGGRAVVGFGEVEQVRDQAGLVQAIGDAGRLGRLRVRDFAATALFSQFCA